MSGPAESHLAPADLERFCEYFRRRTGMTFGEDKRYYIDRRVAERMAAAGDATFADYFSRLRSHAAELEATVNAFTVNETYFYREPHQFRCLSRSLLPEITARKGPGDRVRVWSIPCSTGEEPYSIAIWLLENWPIVDAFNVEISGSDIDSKALDNARDGRYEPRSLARLSADLVERYFEAPEPDVGGQAGRRIIQDLRESVAYSTVNLVDRASVAAHGEFEVVFCRNVLIYFDEAARRTAAESLYTSLSPGGFLCLGHTESMARIDDRFEVRRFADAVVYQRPL
jgi:chemotaxis protein methyltransferase CheR